VFGRICAVSRTWKQICHSDKAAWRKRTEFLKAAKLKIFKIGKVEKLNFKCISRHAHFPSRRILG